MTVVHYAIVEGSLVTETGSVPQDTFDDISTLGGETIHVLDEPIIPSQGYWSDGFKPYPPRPVGWVRFDYDSEQWVADPEAKAADLASKRTMAALTKRELMLELKTREILTPADAELAAKGEWPSILQPFLDDLEMLDPDVASDLRIEWAGSASIHRTDTNLMTFAALLGVPDEEVDDIFQITQEGP